MPLVIHNKQRNLVGKCRAIFGSSPTGLTNVPVVLLVEPSWVVPDVSSVPNGNAFNAWSSYLGCVATDAHTIMELAGVSAHRLFSLCTATVATGPISGASFSADGIGRDWVQFSLTGGAGSATVFFNMTTGATQSAVNCTASTTWDGARYRLDVVPSATQVFSGTIYYTILISTDGATLSYAGDVAKGVHLYTATLTQTSCAALLNANGEQALKDYLDRINAIQATKALQPVVGYDATGRMVLIFSAANSLMMNALAALLAGDDIPSTFGVVFQQIGTTGARQIVGLGNSTAVADAYHIPFSATAGVNTVLSTRKAGGVAKSTSVATVNPGVAKSAMVATFTGAAGAFAINGATATGVNTDLNVVSAALAYCAIGGTPYGVANPPPVVNLASGNLRAVVAGLASLADPQAIALSNLLRAYGG